MDSPDPAATPGPSQARPPRSLWPVVVALVIVEILALGGGDAAVYALHSRTYSPERAVTDYFAAQSRGDVSGMMANATFQQGADVEFFNQTGIASMMGVPQNKDVRNVKVLSSRAVDATTQAIAVAVAWAGQQHSQTYTVRKDNSKLRDFIYRSWRIVIPSVTIHITLPNQPGRILVDGITPVTSDVTTIQAVEGYHSVTMNANAFYERTSQIVDGVDGSPAATFAPDVSSSAVAMAAAAVKLALPTCDPSVSDGCLNHVYKAPNDGRRWFVTLPGYGQVFYTTYLVTLLGDLTADMKLNVLADAGKANASGTCTVTVTFDGSSNYNLAGPWTATLTLDAGRFVADLATDCWANKA